MSNKGIRIQHTGENGDEALKREREVAGKFWRLISEAARLTKEFERSLIKTSEEIKEMPSDLIEDFLSFKGKRQFRTGKSL